MSEPQWDEVVPDYQRVINPDTPIGVGVDRTNGMCGVSLGTHPMLETFVIHPDIAIIVGNALVAAGLEGQQILAAREGQ